MQKCITCILIMLVAFLTLSACGNPENQDMQELVTGTAEISDTGLPKREYRNLNINLLIPQKSS